MSALQQSDTDLLARLHDEGAALLVFDAGRPLFRSVALGVRPLLELVDRFPQGITGATAVDRVVGACAARVFLMLKVSRVVAEVMSESARQILEQSGTPYSYNRLIAEIRNRDDTDVCPFEKLSRQCRDTAGLLQAIRNQLGIRA